MQSQLFPVENTTTTVCNFPFRNKVKGGVVPPKEWRSRGGYWKLSTGRLLMESYRQNLQEDRTNLLPACTLHRLLANRILPLAPLSHFILTRLRPWKILVYNPPRGQILVNNPLFSPLVKILATPLTKIQVPRKNILGETDLWEK